ncbi:MAG: phosphohydrolase, partial [Planctomycetes bacterium]|nr:phosphohydrolase [Planctomycetota bacterium]
MRRLWEWWQARPSLRATVGLLAAGLFLNVGPASLVKACGAPLYLDCIGTVLTAMLGGALPAALVGFCTNGVNALSDPDALYYGVISIIIAAVAAFCHQRRMFRTPRGLLVVAATLAAIGGGVGAVITYFLYGMGIGTGATSPVAHFLQGWLRLGPFAAELLADLVADFLDKAMVVAAAATLFRLLPRGARLRCDRVFLHDSRHVAADKPILHSLLRKVIVAVMAAEILLGALACTISYFLYRSAAIGHFTMVAKGVTHHAACLIDPGRVDEFLAKGRAAPGYAATEKMLMDVKRSFAVTKYLYVYRILPDGCHVVFDLPSQEDEQEATGVEPGKPGEVVAFDESFAPYLPQLLKGEAIEPVISDDTYGWLLTAYTPLKDASGATVAYVAADIAMDSLVSDQAQFFIRMLSLFFGLSIVIMSAVIELVKRDIIVPVNQMATAATKFAFATTLAGGVESANVDLARIRHAAERVHRLKIHSLDEIGHLYDSFATMVLNTYDFIAQVQRQGERINQMQNVIITEFAEVVEARDKSTGDHVKKTAAYVEALARQLQKEGK